MLRRTTQNYDNAEYIRPDDHQGDPCGNTERPETTQNNVNDNAGRNLYGNLKF